LTVDLRIDLRTASESMERVLEVLNHMQGDGVFEKYAIGGGIAAVYYLEPHQTDDIDVFILPGAVSESGLGSVEPIYSYLEGQGCLLVREGGVQIEDWLVRFVLASDALEEEAIAQARRVKYEDTYTFIFSAEHLGAELLRSVTLKDQMRLIALTESDQLDMKVFRDILSRHGLSEKWNEFTKRSGQEK
jgi:hypothetical protein